MSAFCKEYKVTSALNTWLVKDGFLERHPEKRMYYRATTKPVNPRTVETLINLIRKAENIQAPAIYYSAGIVKSKPKPPQQPHTEKAGIFIRVWRWLFYNPYKK